MKSAMESAPPVEKPPGAASCKNPYAVTAISESPDRGWTDGDCEFTFEEIRIQGDTELPRLCIGTGVSEDLVQQQHTLRPMTPAFRWILHGVCAIFVSAWLIEHLPVAAVAPLLIDPPLHWILIAAIAAWGIWVTFSLLTKSVKVTWYIHEQQTLRGSGWRKIWLLSFILIMVGIPFALQEFLETPWAHFTSITFCMLSGVLSNRIVHTWRLTSYSTSEGQICLKGHSPEFVRAWLNRIADENNAAPVSDQPKSTGT